MANRNNDGWETSSTAPKAAAQRDSSGWESGPSRAPAQAAPAAPRPQGAPQSPAMYRAPQDRSWESKPEPPPSPSLGRQMVDFARPTVEMLSAAYGGRLAQTMPGGPFAKVARGVGGAALGFGMSQEALRGAEMLADKPERRPPVAGAPEVFTRAIENIGTGATYDILGRALSPVVGPVVGGITGLARSATGAVRQAFSPQQRAASMVREAAGGSAGAAEARRLLKGAQPDEIPGQTLARILPETGKPAGEFVTLQSLLDRALQRSDPEYLASLIGRQDARRLETLQKMAGGADQTAARQAREEAQKIINERLVPALKVEMEAANVAGRMAPQLEREVGRMSQAAADKVEDVRRFTAAGERARGAQEFPVSGMPRVSTQITYRGDLARRADQVAEAAAEGSLRFGDAARFKQAALDSLEAYGLRPLTGDSIQRGIAMRLSDPRIAAGNRDLEGVLSQVSDDIQKWTQANGVIDAWALDSIRKHAINSYVNKLQLNPKQSRELAASMVQQVRPLLIDAVEEAGGTGYRAYLQAYANEMRGVNQMKLMAKAQEMYQRSPDDFMRLVRGDSPRDVEKIFGPGQFDIRQEIGDEGLQALSRISSELGTRRAMTSQIEAGAQRAEDIVRKSAPSLTAPNLLNREIALLNRAMRFLGSRIQRKTVEQLTEAAKTAGSLDELLSTIPAREAARIKNELARQLRAERALLGGPAMLGLQSEPSPVPSQTAIEMSRFGGITGMQPRIGERNATR